MPAPTHGNGGRTEGVFEDQVPADNPSDQLAQSRVGIGVGAARNGDHRREFGIAETRESASDARHNEREDDGGAGKLRRGLPGDDEDPGADNRADTQGDQVQYAERALQAMFAGFL